MTTAATTLRGAPAVRLAVGVIVLEFATAASTFATGALLPMIERDLSAERQLPLLVAGTTVGMFTALPLSARIIHRYPARAVLAGGLVLSLAGSALAAGAVDPWTFAAGRFVAGLAGAVLAVYGVNAVIRHLDEAFRLKVMAAMSAMWLVPALVGPSLTLALEHLAGWRLALLAPLPLMVLGRLLVVRPESLTHSDPGQRRPVARSILAPVGVAAFVALDAAGMRPAAWGALILALVGFVALLPAGTARLRPGVPAAMAGLTLFGAGFFGASGLVTLLLTHTFHASGVQSGIALSAPQVAWSLGSLLAPRLHAQGDWPTWGLTVTTAGVGVVAILGLTGGAWIPAVAAWAISGLGVGLAYPGLYLRATTAGSGFSAAQLATAVITTESFGGLVGSSAGAALASTSGSFGLTRADAFAWCYAAFAAVLGVATIAARRSRRHDLPAPVVG